jgi:hypothetical protein
MLSLSRQHAAAASEVEKSSWLDAGQALLANNTPMTTYPSTGPYLSLLLIALAGLLLSTLLLRSNRTTAIVGLLASGCDLAYGLTFAIAPSLQVVWIASGGAFWMIWHVLVGRVLLQRLKE